MMMSPDVYYEFELKGRSKAHILKEIRSLRKNIKIKKNHRIFSDQANTMDCSNSSCKYRNESFVFKRGQESPRRA